MSRFKVNDVVRLENGVDFAITKILDEGHWLGVIPSDITGTQRKIGLRRHHPIKVGEIADCEAFKAIERRQLSNRRIVRAVRADKVCRELRHALSEPAQADWNKVSTLLAEWLKVAGRDKYVRP